MTVARASTRAQPLGLALVALALVSCGGAGGSPPAPLTTDEAIRACAAYSGCINGSLGGCIKTTLPLELSREQARCLAQAGADCEAALGCVGTTLDPARQCDPEQYSCEGHNQVICRPTHTSYTDCRQVPLSGGPTCIMGKSGNPQCALGSCDTADTACNGSVLTQCDELEGVRIFIRDCADAGLKCSASANGASCVSTGPACEAPRCDGTTAVTCLGGHEVASDCAAILADSTCAVDQALETATCVLGNGCTPEAATCTGTVLNFCAAGLQQTLDCATLGFSTCSIDGHCQP